MTRRPAVTLMEVLIAMFIMAIGMLALMVLFPVGAVSMAQALKDDRCAYASTVSENLAIATNVRYGDTYVSFALNNPNPPNANPAGLVYVDPYGVLAMPGPLAPYGANWLGGVIPRVAPSFVYQPATLPASGTPLLPLIDRWFSLPDDISFNLTGTADVSNTGGVVDRGRRYSFAYLLRRQPSVAPTALNPYLSPIYSVQLYAVVYAGRPTNSLTGNDSVPIPVIPPSGATGTNSIVINPALIPAGSGIKRGGWILDPINGYFYRVTNLADSPATGTTTVEVQQTIYAPVTNITIMDYVAEVFDKGMGWQQ